MKDKNAIKGMIKDTIIITVITLITGLLLGIAYQITKEPIAEQEVKKKAEACKQVFAAADAQTDAPELTFNEVTGVNLNEVNATLEKEGYKGNLITELYTATTSDGETYGYVIGVLTKEGYGGNITFYMGIDQIGTLTGVSLLSISETPGLGMEAGSVLIPQFANKTVDAFTVTKAGAMADNEIDAISSATVTSKAITNAVNAGLSTFRTLKEGGKLQ